MVAALITVLGLRYHRRRVRGFPPSPQLPRRAVPEPRRGYRRHQVQALPRTPGRCTCSPVRRNHVLCRFPDSSTVPAAISDLLHPISLKPKMQFYLYVSNMLHFLFHCWLPLVVECILLLMTYFTRSRAPAIFLKSLPSLFLTYNPQLILLVEQPCSSIYMFLCILQEPIGSN